MLTLELSSKHRYDTASQSYYSMAVDSSPGVLLTDLSIS